MSTTYASSTWVSTATSFGHLINVNVVAGGVMLSGCSCVCQCVRASRTLLTRCLEKCWTCFYQILSIVVLWHNDERFKFWVQKIKVQGHGRPNMLTNTLFGLVNAMSWKSLDWISPNFKLWRILGQEWTLQFWGQKVKDQGHSKVRLCVEFWFLVSVINKG